jgi:hypothetical protein
MEFIVDPIVDPAIDEDEPTEKTMRTLACMVDVCPLYPCYAGGECLF